MKKVISSLVDFVKNNLDTGLNVWHLIKQGKTEDALEDLKKSGKFSDEQIEALGAVLVELDQKGFEDEVRNILGACQLEVEDFLKYAAGLQYIYNNFGEEERDNAVLCMATISDPKLRNKVIHKILSASHENGKFNKVLFCSIMRAYSTTTDPADPFTVQIEKVNQAIKKVGKDFSNIIDKVKDEVNKIDDSFSKLDKWVKKSKTRRKKLKRSKS